MEKIEESYMQPGLSLGDKVDKLLAAAEGKSIKPRKSMNFKLPMAAKIGNVKLKNGYATIVEIAENDAVSFTREQIVDGTVKLKDTYHSVHDKDVLTYKGRPCLIIPKKSTSPYNPNRVVNNTFSQKHIMSRMMNEVLSGAKKGIGALGISIGGLVLGSVLIYAFIAG